MNSIFSEPFAYSYGTSRAFLRATVVGVLVGLIALFLEPFGSSAYQGTDKITLLVGFGLVAFLATLFMDFLLPKIATGFYNEHSWSFGKEILQFLLIAFLVGATCLLYAKTIAWNADLSSALILFFSVLVALGIYAFYERGQNQQRYAQNAGIMNQYIKNLSFSASALVMPMVWKSRSQSLSLLPNQLIMAEHDGNNTQLFYQTISGGVESANLTASWRNVQEELKKHPQFFQCHPNYIVNLRGINQVTGDARGYHVKMARVNREITVPKGYQTDFEKMSA